MHTSMLIHPDELSKKWIDRLANAGVTAIGIHPPGGKVAAEQLKKLIERARTSEYRELIDYAHFRGLEVEYELHAASFLLPREYFSENPAYYRMNADGERTSDWNFCVTNKEALDTVAKNAADLALSLYGSSHTFYFWTDDGHGIHCHCPNCRHLSPSDQSLITVNRMLCEIRKHIPDAKMAYLAYMDTIVPPANVTPSDGVFLEYAPFEKYTAKGENADNLIKREKEMLEPLMEFFKKGTSKVLEYWYDNSMLSGWKKPPARFVLDREAMLRDIAEYRSMGFGSISSFACFLGEDYEELYGDFEIADLSRAASAP